MCFDILQSNKGVDEAIGIFLVEEGRSIVWGYGTKVWLRISSGARGGKSSVGKSCSGGGGLEEKVIRIKGRSSVCDLDGLVSMSGIRFLFPFICSTVKV
ncbi:hypothetical protein SADUNF_SadunfUnG0000300 [Salix dunnii]|uniref:Uncharacterized protein n=1 Tax=Salix dunnii TaxID=1413687 RepID=A0A835IZB9_9ROSI|nr:hypothetical protein SADUNF_SadunfUnG0000300 [Salix dunnii]